MSKSKIFIYLAIAFAGGVWFASRFTFSYQLTLFALAVVIIFLALSFGAKNFYIPFLFLILAAALLGTLRLQLAQQPNEYQKFFDSKQQWEGYIVEDPDLRIANQFLTVQPKGFNQEILVSAPLSQDYVYGDWVLLNGKVEQPQNFDNFDYQHYLERYNIYAVMKYPKILVLKSHRLNFFKGKLLDVKHAFIARIDRLLPEPEASLLMGILIGARKTLPQTVVDNFNNTGVSHIIAISGYNITIIISALGFLASRLGRRARLWLTLLVIVGFVILSGASASVIRAAIMGGLFLFSSNIGRQYSVGPALFFAALCMLVINPKILYWDASFQLSFLATLGIVYFEPLLARLTEHWPEVFGVKSVLLTTLSAILATLPLILFEFGRLSAVAPLVNILILPIIPLVMLLGFLSVLPIVGPGCAFVANFLLIYILRTTALFAAIPYGNFAVRISQYIFLALALGIFGLYFMMRRWALGRVRAGVDR